MVFNNRFNNKDKDPLVEAAKGAMMEGELRRQAINAVNEEFGVFNRNAVIREHLAAYDARIEEAYKCMKEGKPLSPKQQKMASLAGDPKKIDAADLASLRKGAKIDEKKGCYEEGTAEAETSMNVTSGGKPATPAQTTSAPQNAPMPPKRPANLQELKKPTAKTAMAAFHRASDSEVRSGEFNRSNRLYAWKQKHLPGKSARNQKDTGKAELDDHNRKVVKKGGTLTKASQKDTKAEIKSRLGKHTKPHLPEETIEEAVSRKHFQQVADLIKGHESQEKRNELASHHAGIFAKQNPRFDHGRFHKAAGSTAHEAPKSVKESVLAAVRAKYVREQVSLMPTAAAKSSAAKAPIIPKSALAPGQSLRDYMNAEKGLTRRDAPKPSTSAPTPKPAAATGSMQSTPGVAPTASKPAADLTTKNSPSYNAARNASEPDQNKELGKPAEKSQSNFLQSQGIGVKPAEKPDTMPKIDTGPKADPNPDQGNIKLTTTQPKDITQKNSPSYKSAQDSLAESVQVGANRYRIV